jgi:rhodanese-related sulfurtransferase
MNWIIAAVPVKFRIMDFKKLVKQTCILLGVSVVVALIVNYFSPVGIALMGQWDTTRGVITAKAKNDVVAGKLEIEDVSRAKQLFDNGNVLFVDARTLDSYNDGHIPGAESLPVGQFDELIDAFLDKHPTEKPIVTYCSGRTCEDSHNLAQLLVDFGYGDVKVFIDGFPGWQAEGYPIE